MTRLLLSSLFVYRKELALFSPLCCASIALADTVARFAVIPYLLLSYSAVHILLLVAVFFVLKKDSLIDSSDDC